MATSTVTKPATESLGKGFTRQGNLIKYQKTIKAADCQKRICVYGKTAQECEQKFKQEEENWRKEIILGINIKCGHLPLHQAMQDYFLKHNKINSRKRAIKRSTHSTNMRVLKNQIAKYPIGEKYADKIKADDLQNHIETLIEDGYSESTVKKAKDLLRTYYFSLYNHSLANPAYSIIVPHLESTEKTIKSAVDWDKILDDNEIVRFLNECNQCYIPKHKGTKYADLLKFLFYTYMRVGEACALKVQDYECINGEGYINIKSTISRAGNIWYIDTPKYKSGIRRIKLGNEMKTLIEEKIKEKNPQELIWCQANGDFVKYTSLEKPFKNMITRIGCSKNLSIHSLRHTGISFALRHGANIAAVSKNAGHTSIAITQDIYQHILQKEKDEAVELAEAALTKLIWKAEE